MTEQPNSLKTTKAIWSQVRAFGSLWLALVCLGGFVVLIGGPWILALLSKILGPAAAKPGRVIALDMIFMLPFAVYFYIQQRQLSEGHVACRECGRQYPKTKASCPMCGCVNSENNTATELAAAKT
jgi:ribosomal protein L37E